MCNLEVYYIYIEVYIVGVKVFSAVVDNYRYIYVRGRRATRQLVMRVRFPRSLTHIKCACLSRARLAPA